MKRVTILLDEELHKAAKIKAVILDKTFIQYVAELIQKDITSDSTRKKEQTQ